jgi:hypothetical protein
MTKKQICEYIIESLESLPIDILNLLYKIVMYHESGLE